MIGAVEKPFITVGAANGAGNLPETAAPNALQPLALRSMFWRPNHATDSPWLEHVPFVFWLVEAHRPRLVVELGSGPPVLYFAFCQAIERLELDGACMRISAHDAADAGASGAFQEACAYNASQYSGFSRIEAGDIRAARHQFEDGSIDVLHVADSDGALSAEDLADWTSKLSPQGLLLLHGPATRLSVPTGRPAAALRAAHPAFEFSHGNGLSVIAVGAEQPELIKLLCMTSGNPQATRAAHEVFFRLGRACADSHAAVMERAGSARLKESIEDYRRRMDALQAELGKVQASLSDRMREADAAQYKLDAQVEQHAVERGQLSEKVTLLQEVRLDLRKQIESMQARVDAAAAEVAARAQRVASLEEQRAQREVQFQEIQAAVNQRDAALAEYRAHAGALEDVRAKLQARVEALEAELAARAQDAAGMGEERAKREAQFQDLQTAVSNRDAALAEYQAHTTALEDLRVKLRARAEAAEAELITRAQHIATLEERGAAREAAVEALQAAVNERDVALAEYNAQVTAQKDLSSTLQERLEAAEADLASRTQHLVNLEQQGGLREEQIEQMQATLGRYETESLSLQERIASLEHAVQEKSEENAALVQERMHLQDSYAAVQADLDEAKRQQREVEAAVRQTEARLGVAHQELADLTLLLAEAERKLAEAQESVSALTLREQALQTAFDERQLQHQQQLQAEHEDRQALQLQHQQQLQAVLEERDRLAQKVQRCEAQLLVSSARFLVLQKEFGRAAVAPQGRGRRRRKDDESKRAAQACDIVRKSGLFDEEWYLNQYRDVAGHRMDPLKHYLNHGATELRDPGPHFSTAAYVATHGPLLAQGENPLLHYLANEAVGDREPRNATGNA